MEAVIADCHPQVEWHPHLSSLAGQAVQGHAGVRRYLASLAGEGEEFRQEHEQFFDAEDAVVDVRVAHVITFENGRCIKSVSYLDRSEALEAVGLSE